jgi:hypothetical protein
MIGTMNDAPLPARVARLDLPAKMRRILIDALPSRCPQGSVFPHGPQSRTFRYGNV